MTNQSPRSGSKQNLGLTQLAANAKPNPIANTFSNTTSIPQPNGQRLGLLTGGGDAPGLNGVIESCSRALLAKGYEMIGICDGFEGVYNSCHLKLSRQAIFGIHSQAGTLLGTSNRSGTRNRESEFLERFKEMKLAGLIVAGGDGTFAALKALGSAIPLIGVPKTIDNDLSGTDVTFGFDTACSVIAEAVDSLRATAEAHRRVMVVEAMGRTAGWLALGGGLAAYADAILIPERPFSRAEFLRFLRKKQEGRARGLVIVVSEGAMAQGETAQVAFSVPDSPQSERYGGVAATLARWIEKETGWESRHVVLGHLQRSRHPTVTDCFLTLAMGVEVARMVEENCWGQAVVVRDGQVHRAPIEDLMQAPRLVDHSHRWVLLAQALEIFI